MDGALHPRQSGGGLDDFQFYYYQPSLAAAAVLIAAFGLTTGLHFWQMFRTKTWFLIPFIIGGCFEFVGYIGRALSAGENPGPYTLGPYIIQSILILVAPALFAASIYMELARVVHMIDGDDALFIRRTWLTKIFVGGDVLSFLMQSSGGGLLASGDVDQQDMGENVVVGGLFVQIIFFGMFVVAAIIFQVRQSRRPSALAKERPWKKHMMGLYVVSVLIFVRSIVRVVEYLQGYDGYLMTREIFIYVFDALPMAVAMATMNWIHPGEVAFFVREKEREEAAEKSHVEMQDQQAWQV